MFLVDSHCHLNKLNFYEINKNVSDVLNRSRNSGVKAFLSVCTELSDFYEMSKNIQEKFVFFSCGIHPIYANKKYNFHELYNLSNKEKVIALGETGLDYYKNSNKVKQQKLFYEHIFIAKKLRKPIIVHTRNSKKDTISILKSNKSSGITGVIHCFTEDTETMKHFLDLGFYISFSGIITFQNSLDLKKVIQYIPIDRLLLETDAPYLTPEPFRGKENQPIYVKTIAEFVARLKSKSLNQLAKITTMNFSKLFNVKLIK